MDIAIGKMTPLISVIENGENLPINFDETSINENLSILDDYLQWRMTDSQKTDFGIL
ncbi:MULTISPECIES: hypothetical protein [Listeria]|uniref:hypothetical protein n=1 Tax=Listeria TaxID=1637 RepID=UPI001356566B|nr:MULTISPECIES: hypothetical protein [Listeria]